MTAVRDRIQLVVAIAVCLVAGYLLLNREGEDTASLLQGGGAQSGGTGGEGPEVPEAAGLDDDAAGAITDVVSLSASNQEPCDYYTEKALSTYAGPGRPPDAYDACLAVEGEKPRIDAGEVKIVSIKGRGRRATVRFEAGGKAGTARLVDVGGEWLLSRPLP